MSELSPSGPTPPRPDPWATTAPQEGLRDNDQARIVSLAPSINLTPRGNVMVPLPYNLVDYAGHDESYTPTVRFTSQRAMVLRSFTQHVHGDEQGTGGGVKSGTHGGICEPIGHAPQVLAEGSPVIRHLDRFWMNNRNTVGEAVFVRDTATYAAPPDRDPIPGSAPTVRSEASRAPMTVADSVAPALLGFAYSPPTFAPPIETLPPITGIRPPIGGVGASILLSLAWASGAVVGEWAREVASGEAGDVARQLMIILEEQVPRGTGQGGAIKEADGPLPYVGYEGDIRFANKLLSLKKGEIVDFRAMTPAEFKELVERPWPSAEGIRENERKLEEEKKRPHQPPPVPIPDGNVRVDSDPKCRSETICFDKKESSDPEIPHKFDDQLKMQQDALNAKTPAQVVTSIPANGTVDSLRPQARSAQKAARDDYIARNRTRFLLTHTLGQWETHLDRLNALHRLDMVAGGDPSDIIGMGDADANQAIGREWPADRRRGALRRYAAEMAALKCPMNIRLSVC